MALQGCVTKTHEAPRDNTIACRRFYNEDRPHSAIGYKIPIALTEPGGEAGPPP
ncbi:transposase InsO family protein [Amaricoccus macauensis]|uniref:Transposase InsO family protein n=1 Tax=Amaricoccus macauensis TaxID=57001 RepID=A0A840SM85_9RHOB|nr:hypothetical protein [Amaricoccus macauensis]MBB5223097.1 transposase InsO family protein [Amaricoccus macauensis]